MVNMPKSPLSLLPGTLCLMHKLFSHLDNVLIQASDSFEDKRGEINIYEDDTRDLPAPVPAFLQIWSKCSWIGSIPGLTFLADRGFNREMRRPWKILPIISRAGLFLSGEDDLCSSSNQPYPPTRKDLELKGMGSRSIMCCMSHWYTMTIFN